MIFDVLVADDMDPERFFDPIASLLSLLLARRARHGCFFRRSPDLFLFLFSHTNLFRLEKESFEFQQSQAAAKVHLREGLEPAPQRPPSYREDQHREKRKSEGASQLILTTHQRQEFENGYEGDARYEPPELAVLPKTRLRGCGCCRNAHDDFVRLILQFLVD